MNPFLRPVAVRIVPDFWVQFATGVSVRQRHVQRLPVHRVQELAFEFVGLVKTRAPTCKA
jgi:hypothetical protein